MNGEKTDDRQMVEDKAPEFRDLFARMDSDRDLYFLKPFVMMNPDGSTPMDDVENVTFNDALTFALRSIAVLGSAERQIIVEGRNMSEKQCTTIENFLNDIQVEIDNRLANRDILDLDTFINEQICVRGSIAGRSCLRVKEKKFIPDVIPLDTRFLVYDTGIDGLKWGAHTTTRSKGRIKEEYGIEPTEDELQVIDLWKPEEEVIFIGDTEEKRQKNPYGYPPIVKAQSASGSLLQDKEAAQHRGESIFWANRGLFPQMNLTASILQTLNIMSFAGGLQFESEAGLKAKKPAKPPYGKRVVVPVEKGMGYKPMPINDIRNATRLFYAILYTRIQQGGLSAIDYGNLTFPLSAVAIARLTASRDQIFIPRLQAKAIFYQQLYKMIIKQYMELRTTASLGETGFKTEYKASDLEGDYNIKFRFFSESKEEKIANLSVAISAKGTVSGDTILRQYIKVQDPDAEAERISAEEAEKVDEALFLYNKCSRFIAQGKQVPAWVMYRRLERVLMARMGQGMVAPEEEPSKKIKQPPSTPLIPLVGGGGGASTTPGVGTEQEEMARAEEEAVAAERTSEKGAEAKQEEVR